MKKEYITPKIEIETIEITDILVTSVTDTAQSKTGVFDDIFNS